jgi:hypothetical protein
MLLKTDLLTEWLHPLAKIAPWPVIPTTYTKILKFSLRPPQKLQQRKKFMTDRVAQVARWFISKPKIPIWVNF